MDIQFDRTHKASVPVAVESSGSKGGWSVWIALVCVAATVFGIYRLLGPGPFDWHVYQPEFRHGVVEFVSIWMVCFSLLVLRVGRVRWIGIGIVLALYMRMHGTDLALLLGVAYCFGIYGLGMAVLPTGYAMAGGDGYLFRAHALRSVLGLSLMGLFLMLGALLFKWGFEANRIAGLCMAGLGLLFVLRRARRWIRAIPESIEGQDRTTKAALSLLLATAAIGIARSNLPFFFDSAWYGLRPDRVLLGDNGFYESLGLTTQVHYYPKLYELVLAPLQGMGDVSNVVVIGVVCALLLVLAVVSLVSVFGLSVRHGLVHAALLVCYPAVMGTVETPKGDILAAALVIFAFVSLCRALETRSHVLLLDVALYCLLASTIRLSALPWLAVLFIGWSFAIGVQVSSRAGWASWRWRAFIPLLLVLVAFVLTHVRTYWLTGVPVITNSGLQETLSGFGFDLREPIGGLTGSGDANVGIWGGLKMLAGFALTPEQYPLHVFKWTGAAWLVYLLVIALHPERAFAGWRGLVALSGIVLFPVLVAFNHWPVGAPGGDGNYYIVPIAMIYACGVAVIRVFHPFALSLLLLCSGAGTCAYIMGANWEVGTGRTAITLAKSPFDEPGQVSAYLGRSGLNAFAERIERCGRDVHMIGELRTPGAYLLPVRFEPFEELAWNNTAAFGSPDRFQRFLRNTGTDLVALPSIDSALPPVAEERLAMLGFVRAELEAGEGVVSRLSVEGVDVYATSAQGAACLRLAASQDAVD